MRATQKQMEIHRAKQKGQTARRVVSILFIVLEILLAVRLMLRWLGAGEQGAFTRVINAITKPFVWPFRGIFGNTSQTQGSYFELETLMAMAVVAIIGWLIILLITPQPNRNICPDDSEPHGN